MKINEIVLDPRAVPKNCPVAFKVGEVPTNDDGLAAGPDPVEKINFNGENRIFNKGLEVGFAAYAVYLVGNPERIVIAAKAVVVVSVEKIVNQEAEANIPLPE